MCYLRKNRCNKLSQRFVSTGLTVVASVCRGISREWVSAKVVWIVGWLTIRLTKQVMMFFIDVYLFSLFSWMPCARSLTRDIEAFSSGMLSRAPGPIFPSAL